MNDEELQRDVQEFLDMVETKHGKATANCVFMLSMGVLNCQKLKEGHLSVSDLVAFCGMMLKYLPSEASKAEVAMLADRLTTKSLEALRFSRG